VPSPSILYQRRCRRQAGSGPGCTQPASRLCSAERQPGGGSLSADGGSRWEGVGNKGMTATRLSRAALALGSRPRAVGGGRGRRTSRLQGGKGPRCGALLGGGGAPSRAAASVDTCRVDAGRRPIRPVAPGSKGRGPRPVSAPPSRPRVGATWQRRGPVLDLLVWDRPRALPEGVGLFIVAGWLGCHGHSGAIGHRRAVLWHPVAPKRTVPALRSYGMRSRPGDNGSGGSGGHTQKYEMYQGGVGQWGGGGPTSTWQKHTRESALRCLSYCNTHPCDPACMEGEQPCQCGHGSEAGAHPSVEVAMWAGSSGGGGSKDQDGWRRGISLMHPPSRDAQCERRSRCHTRDRNGHCCSHDGGARGRPRWYYDRCGRRGGGG